MPIPAVDKIWMNGELVDWRDAQVHVLTHALHYGSGVFEGIRAYKTERGPAVFRLTDHLERLRRSAKLYYMELPYSVAELAQATKELIHANGLEHCYIRPIVYRGYGEMGLFPLEAPRSTASIAAWPWGTYLGDEGVKHGVRVKVSSIKSLDNNAITPAAKACGQYLNSQLAKIEVMKGGYEEAIMLNNAGFVAQGTGENIFMVRDGQHLHAAARPAACSRASRATPSSRIAASLGHEVIERDFTPRRPGRSPTRPSSAAPPPRSCRSARSTTTRSASRARSRREIQRVFHEITAGRSAEFGHYLEYVDEAVKA